jgi:transposase
MNEEAGRVSTYSLVDTREETVTDRRRRWPEALKRQIVGETRVPGASVSVVARRHDVNANQVFRWRRQYEAGSTDSMAPLVAVTVRPSPRAAAGDGTIEIELVGGARVRVSGAVDGAALAQVLEQLK